MPSHPVVPIGGEHSIEAVSAAPFGSASILLISWAYIKMLGGEGLAESTKAALLNANYMAHRLKGHYSLRYKNKNGRVAHELLIDLHEFDKAAGLKVTDFAKRLQVGIGPARSLIIGTDDPSILGLWVPSTDVLMADLNVHAHRANRIGVA